MIFLLWCAGSWSLGARLALAQNLHSRMGLAMKNAWFSFLRFFVSLFLFFQVLQASERAVILYVFLSFCLGI